MTKQELKDYRYTCKCIKQLESELNDAAVTDSTQGSQSEYPYVKHSVTISGVPDNDTHLAKKRRLSELKAQKAEVGYQENIRRSDELRCEINSTRNHDVKLMLALRCIELMTDEEGFERRNLNE